MHPAHNLHFAIAAISAMEIFALYVTITRLRFMLRPRIRRVYLAGPEVFQRDRLPDSVRGQVAELSELGFDPLGKAQERGVRNHLVSYDLANAQRRTFATLWHSIGSPNGARLYFFTAFQDGNTLLTATYAHRLETVGPLYCSGLPDQSFAEVLDAHCAQIAQLERAGSVACTDWSQAGRIAACDLFYSYPRSIQPVRQMALKDLLLYGAIAVLLAWPLAMKLMQMG